MSSRPYRRRPLCPFRSPHPGAGKTGSPKGCAGPRLLFLWHALAFSRPERLREKGFTNATSIMGGYSAWLRAGGDVVTDSQFTPAQLDRYSRNMLLKEIGKDGQLKLMNAKVLLVGAGGLGSPAGLYLAACGVGTIGVVDFDRVETSNLNRQVLHGTEDVGRLKVDSAKSAIERINPDVNVVPFATRLTPENAIDIIGDFDVVMDGTDNVETKFLLNDACFFAGIPYVFGGAVGFDGQAGVFWPKEGRPVPQMPFFRRLPHAI